MHSFARCFAHVSPKTAHRCFLNFFREKNFYLRTLFLLKFKLKLSAFVLK